MVAVAAKLAQQVVEPLGFRHKGGRAQQGADVQLGCPLQLEQVFGHEDADDVFALPLVHRKARMRGVDHQPQQLVEGRLDVDEVHAWCGHHHIAGRHVGHADDALKHHAGVGANDFVVLGLGQGFNELFSGVRSGMNELGHFLQKSALVFLVGQALGVRVGHCLGVQDVR
jgi:hypothetical protein